MSYTVATTNLFSLLDEEAPKHAAKPAKKVETKKAQPAKKEAPKKQEGKKEQPAKQAPKKQEGKKEQPAKTEKVAQKKPLGSAISTTTVDVVDADGFTQVTKDRREKKKVHQESANPRKRTFDRHVSGTGRGKEVKRGGAGKANWGNEIEAQQAGADDAKKDATVRPPRSDKPRRPRKEGEEEKPRRPRREGDEERPRRPRKERAEKTEKVEEAPKEPTEEEKAELAKKELEAQEEAKKVTLSEFQKKQAAQKVKVNKKERKVEAASQEGFQVVKRDDNEVISVAKPKAKKEVKEKKPKKVVVDILATAPKEEKGQGKKKDQPKSKGLSKQAVPDVTSAAAFPSLK